MNYLICMLIALLFTACSNNENNTSPMGYNLNSPSTMVLPEVLLEVSGICMKNETDFYAVQDEIGQLYTINQKGKITEERKFSGIGDYEDVVLAGRNIVILRSDGALLSFPDSGLPAQEIEKIKLFENLLPSGEYEGLAFDGKHLYVLCKECGEEQKYIYGYVLSISEDCQIALTGNFKLDTDEILVRSTKKKSFRPSAFAFKASTEEWFVVSSVNKVLVVADKEWKVKDIFQLDHDIFIQPEGIVFDNAGNLYISNEGDKTSPSNILKFSL